MADLLYFTGARVFIRISFSFDTLATSSSVMHYSENLGVKLFNSSSNNNNKKCRGGELFAYDDDDDDFIDKETVQKMLKQRSKLISQQNLPFVHRITTHATTLNFF